jgi:hypothetical protein
VTLTPSAVCKKHAPRNHLQPRDLIIHKAKQTSKPYIKLFFGEAFFGGEYIEGRDVRPSKPTKHQNQKSIFFFWKNIFGEGGEGRGDVQFAR